MGNDTEVSLLVAAPHDARPDIWRTWHSVREETLGLCWLSELKGPKARRLQVGIAPGLKRIDRRRLSQDDHDNEFKLAAELIVRLVAERDCATRSTSTRSLQTAAHVWMRSSVFAFAGYSYRASIPNVQDTWATATTHISRIGGGALHADATSCLHHARAAAPRRT
jgi:hypothetical protein